MVGISGLSAWTRGYTMSREFRNHGGCSTADVVYVGNHKLQFDNYN